MYVLSTYELYMTFLILGNVQVPTAVPVVPTVEPVVPFVDPIEHVISQHPKLKDCSADASKEYS